MDAVEWAKLTGGSDYVIDNGWYAVVGNVSYSESVIVRGDVNLLLSDDSKLIAKDCICVQKDAKLTIWAQSANAKTRGKLIARDAEGKAGIGGIGDEVAGTIIINGGDINARGGHGYAGITGKSITINGGKVYAVGENGGAGIGGAKKSDLVGTVTIKGGLVTASGNGGGAGIGGGWAGNALKGHVNISGGTVFAYGSAGAAGIGGGRGDGENNNIGGQGSHVSITGTANVTACAGGRKRYSRCSAIGHGHNNKEYGTITFGDNMMVQADWSNKAGEAGEPFPWDNRQGGCFYRWYAHIQPCDHRNATFTDITEKTHTLKSCKYCKLRDKKEPHNFNARTRKCKGCGAKYQWTPPTVTFISNGGDGRMAPQKFTPGRAVKLNANTFTCLYHSFKEWNTEPDGSGKSYANGAEVKLNESITLYAQWYTNVIIMAYRRQAMWTGKPQSVEGYSVILESDTNYVVPDAVFPGVTASCTATDIGIYPVEVKGAIVNKTTDRDGVYIVTGIRDGTLMILKPDATFTVTA